MKPVIITTSWDDGHKCDIRLASLPLLAAVSAGHGSRRAAPHARMRNEAAVTRAHFLPCVAS